MRRMPRKKPPVGGNIYRACYVCRAAEGIDASGIFYSTAAIDKGKGKPHNDGANDGGSLCRMPKEHEGNASSKNRQNGNKAKRQSSGIILRGCGGDMRLNLVFDGFNPPAVFRFCKEIVDDFSRCAGAYNVIIFEFRAGRDGALDSKADKLLVVPRGLGGVFSHGPAHLSLCQVPGACRPLWLASPGA